MTSEAITFGTKASTLRALRGRLTSASVLPIVVVTLGEWSTRRGKALNRLSVEMPSGEMIVRSSAPTEDQAIGSQAGKYLSLLDVDHNHAGAAIDRVFRSYGQAPDTAEVLIQPMLTDIVRSGVAFSHDPHTCSSYRVVNWADGSDSTIVTSGRGGRAWQGATGSPIPPPEDIRTVVTLVEELLRVFNGRPLDCEFAITRNLDTDERLWLLQVRPLVLANPPEPEEPFRLRVAGLQRNLELRMGSHPFLLGRRTVYGIMPDWNPAEIIGIRPRPLALSLYRDLVTDTIWAYQRNNYGYRNLRSFPLLVHFSGLPYIDVRVSFNSFIPKNLDDRVATRLVEYYIDRLINNPHLHDKVEFEIVFSSYHLDLPTQLEELLTHGFSRSDLEEIQRCLRDLTTGIIDPRHGLWPQDVEKIAVMRQRRSELLGSDADVLTRIYWLLEDTKRYGTLPFAGLARAGFIAVQFLRSLVSTGLIDRKQYDAFMAGLTTVSGQLSLDWAMLDRTGFLARYGHLRPGTYDILTPRYDVDPDRYFDWSRRSPLPSAHISLSLTLPQIRRISDSLRGHGLNIDVVALFDFLEQAIEWREKSKFEFTRNVSDVLELIADLGHSLGFSRDDMSFVDLRAIQDLYIGSTDRAETLGRSIEIGRKRFSETLRTALPPLIARPEDVWGFETPEAVPNFVTQRHVTALVVAYTEREGLSGAIVCIPSADPGYDWLFGYPIAGLITAWGGANSHMAIRAGELGIPAVIGAGELLYQRWSGSRVLHIDCASHRVVVVEAGDSETYMQEMER